jgi:hypothetical protein
MPGTPGTPDIVQVATPPIPNDTAAPLQRSGGLASPAPHQFAMDKFAPLVQILNEKRLLGRPRLLRSDVANILNRLVYEEAGVTKFKRYAEIAEQAGIVQLGGDQGDAWIELHPNVLPLLANQGGAAPIDPPVTQASRPPAPVPREVESQMAPSMQAETIVSPSMASPSTTAPDDVPASFSTLPTNPSQLYEHAAAIVQNAVSPSPTNSLGTSRGSIECQTIGPSPPAHIDALETQMEMVTLDSVSPTSTSPSLTPSHATSLLPPISNSSLPSEEHSPRLVSSEQPMEEPIPEHLSPLIKLLEEERSKGRAEVLRSRIGSALVETNPQLYTQAGVKGFTGYMDLAKRAGVIQLGGEGGKAWASLVQHAQPGSLLIHEGSISSISSLRTEEGTCLSSSNIDVLETSYKSELVTTSSSSNAAQQSCISLGSASLVPSSCATSPNQSFTANQTTHSMDNVFEDFSALITVLRREQSKGNSSPLRSKIATDLLKEDESAFRKVNLTKFGRYAELARERGVVHLGRECGRETISLHPDWQV